MSSQERLKNVLCSALMLWMTTNSPLASADTAPSNSIWVQSLFFRGVHPSTGTKLTDTDIVKLADDLSHNGIRYAYMFAGPYNENGSLPEYAFSDTARSTVQRLRELAPELQILPWVGGLQDKTVFLNDPSWRARAIEDTIRLATILGVSGVHLDFEYILPTSSYVINASQIPPKRTSISDYHPSLRDFTKELRERAPTLFVSTVFPSSAPQVTPWKANPSRDDITSIAPHVSQISFLFYDTSIRSQQTFQAALNHQMNDIIAAHQRSPETEFLLAFGTFVNEPELHSYRDLSLENIPNSFATLRQTITNSTGGRNPLAGIALFCEWHTEATEWAQFKDGITLVAPFKAWDNLPHLKSPR